MRKGDTTGRMKKRGGWERKSCFISHFRKYTDLVLREKGRNSPRYGREAYFEQKN